VSGNDNFSFVLDSDQVGTDLTIAFYLTDVPNTSANPIFEILAFFDSDNGGGFLATPLLIVNRQAVDTARVQFVPVSLQTTITLTH
jgi:hypothetical protein